MPFTEEQFFEVFKRYNLAVWPLHVLFYSLAVAAIFLAIRRKTASAKTITYILSFFWLWMGIAYHFTFFSSINKAAYIFGSLFFVQGILFIIIGVFQKKFSFEFEMNSYGITGLILMVYALFVYPLFGYLQGHVYPYSPTFGLPCPTTIFTLGMLLWTKWRPPFLILIIPFLWSIIGSAAAFSLGIQEDIGLGISGFVVTIMEIKKSKRVVNLEKIPELIL